MKKAVSTLLVVALVASPITSWAQDKPSVAPTPTPVISPLNRGQVSPFTGVLFSPEAVAQVIAQQDTERATAALALQHQADVDAAQKKYALDSAASTYLADRTILLAQLTDVQKQNQALQDQLKSNSSGPGAPVWIGIGVAGGIVVTLVTALAISKL